MERKFCTDDTMAQLYLHLTRDFGKLTGLGKWNDNRALLIARRDIPAFRRLPTRGIMDTDPLTFKVESQLHGLFKRYRFENDLYSDSELEELTNRKFSDLQVKLAKCQWKSIKASTHLAVQQARRIVREVLADYDPSDAEFAGRFSTRATKGNSARNAYLDFKLFDPITGSPQHIEWFKTHLSENKYLARTLEMIRIDESFEECASLNLVGVPKSYKSFRLIQPNTLIGSYRSFGLGAVLVEALKAIGLDIRHLQRRHQEIARVQSRKEKRQYVTADMSAASESFTWSLLCRLLPRKWLRALSEGRCKYYTAPDGSDHYYCSFMAMGIGFTFPLQTLLFYALCKSVCTLLKVRGFVSVYGDDLIYPRQSHKAITSVLTDLGMALNQDKTFVEECFRESCGGDYFHGVDVRPFSYEGECQQLDDIRYESFCYKLVNGLKLRYPEWMIPSTMDYLKSQILRVAPAIKQVPKSMPEMAGWRVSQPRSSEYMFPFMTKFGHVPVKFEWESVKRFYGPSHVHQWKFKHLCEKFEHRDVCFVQAYLYDWLRARENNECRDEDPPLYGDGSNFRDWMTRLSIAVKNRDAKWDREGTQPSLTYRRSAKQPRNYSRLGGKFKIHLTVATTPCLMTQAKVQQRTSVTYWDAHNPSA